MDVGPITGRLGNENLRTEITLWCLGVLETPRRSTSWLVLEVFNFRRVNVVEK